MDGRLFMQLYGLQSESQLPHIAIIDSRTGMSVVKLTVGGSSHRCISNNLLDTTFSASASATVCVSASTTYQSLHLSFNFDRI